MDEPLSTTLECQCSTGKAVGITIAIFIFIILAGLFFLIIYNRSSGVFIGGGGNSTGVIPNYPPGPPSPSPPSPSPPSFAPTHHRVGETEPSDTYSSPVQYLY